MPRIMSLLAVVTTLVLAVGATRAQPGEAGESSPGLPYPTAVAGTRIRAVLADTSSTRVVTGLLLARDASRFEILLDKPESRSIAFANSEINSLAISDGYGRQTRNGLMLGMLAGFVIGRAINAQSSDDMFGADMEERFAVGAGCIAGCGLVGAIVGTFFKGERWETQERAASSSPPL